MWKTLGYVPAVAKFKSKDKRMLIDSGHVDSIAFGASDPSYRTGCVAATVAIRQDLTARSSLV